MRAYLIWFICPLNHVSTSTFYDKIYSESTRFCLSLLIIQTRDGRGSFFNGVVRGGARPKIYGPGRGGRGLNLRGGEHTAYIS